MGRRRHDPGRVRDGDRFARGCGRGRAAHRLQSAVVMHPTRLSMARRLLIALALVTVAACGDGVTNDRMMHVPTDSGEVCQGYSHGVWVRLCCEAEDAASDGFCHYQLRTSNASVLTIWDSTHSVAANTCEPRKTVATVGSAPGTVDLVLRNTTSGREGTIGTATVGNQSCI
jgi:hypothetical protein